MSGTIVLGVDPGCRETGIVLRVDDGVADFTVLERTDTAKLPGGEYVACVIQRIDSMWTRAGQPTVAVEGVNIPNPHLGMTNVGGQIGCAIVLGAVLGVFADAVVVPPGRNGSGPKAAYPDELWGPREGVAGKGRLRHCRSAFDVAGAALKLQAIEARVHA